MENVDKGDSPQLGENVIQLPLHWGPIDEAPTIYSNQLIITHAGSEFYLVFGEIFPPIVLRKEEVPEILTVRPIVKIAISFEQMQEFVKVINNNFDGFMAKMSIAEKKNG